MPTATATPEHLLHHEARTEPFTEQELAAIHAYEEGDDGHLDATAFSVWLSDVNFLAERTDADTRDGDGFTAAQIRSTDRANILAAFDWLSRWYEALDTLKSGLRNPLEGPAHSTAGYRYLQAECNQWYRVLNRVRREACRYAFGTAGPQPEVDAGHLTFFDIPGIELDGTIAAESQ